MIVKYSNAVADKEYSDENIAYHSEIDSIMQTLRGKAFAKDVYGIKDNRNYDIINDLFFLKYLLYQMKFEKDNNEKMGISKTDEYYKTEYSLPCKAESFMCDGIDINPLIEIFL